MKLSVMLIRDFDAIVLPSFKHQRPWRAAHCLKTIAHCGLGRRFFERRRASNNNARAA